jgi:hypothetical protein
VKALPSVEALWKNNKDKGLHIFLVESQGGTLEDITKYAQQRGLTFPIPIASGSDFSNFPGGNGLPYAFVIGPDGKVAWQGRDGYASAAVKELERIKYPGLGKLDVAPELVKAATSFGTGNYAAAREEALKVKEKEADNEAAVADADYIIKRVDDRVVALRARIEANEKAKSDADKKKNLIKFYEKYEGMAAAEEAKTLADALSG